MKQTKAAGAVRERQVRQWYRDRGWVALKSSDSSVVDVIALKAGCVPHLIEVKGNAGSPWMNFRKADREALLAAALGAGAKALLAHWPPRGELRFIPWREWP